MGYKGNEVLILYIVSGYLWYFHSLLARTIVSILCFHKVSLSACRFIHLPLDGDSSNVARYDS